MLVRIFYVVLFLSWPFVLQCREVQIPKVHSANPRNTRAFGWPAGRKAGLSITFDDGYSSQVIAGKLLAERGLRATFYLTPAVVSAGDVLEWTKLYAAGNEIGNHSLHHIHEGDRRAKLSAQDEADEIGRAEGWLDNTIFHTASPREHSFAYPGGAYFFGPSSYPGTTEAERTLRQQNACDFATIVSKTNSFARTGDGGPNDPFLVDTYRFFIRGQVVTSGDIGKTPLVKVQEAVAAGIATGKWVVLVFHGIAAPGAQPSGLEVSYQQYIDIINYLKSKETEIWIRPFIEVAREIDRQLPVMGFKCDLGRASDGPACRSDSAC